MCFPSHRESRQVQNARLTILPGEFEVNERKPIDMSRSRRKRPFTGWAVADSDKEDKQISNRRLRRISKVELSDGWDDEDFILPDIREVSNVYFFAKDGKQMFDPIDWPKGMRK